MNAYAGHEAECIQQENAEAVGWAMLFAFLLGGIIIGFCIGVPVGAIVWRIFS